MGNLQSVLGDCQLGQVPAYLQQYVSKDGDGGDEAYMVYGERSPFQKSTEDKNMYYTGPSQKHVRANLLRDNSRDKKVLSEIVDLCVDGVEETTPPGSQPFTLPRKSTHQTSELWDEAELKAQENGAVRVVPPGSRSATKKKHKSKKKHKKRKADDIVQEMVSEYPQSVRDLLRESDSNAREQFDMKDKRRSNSVEEEEERVEDEDVEDDEYVSEVETEETNEPNATAATAEGGSPLRPTVSGRRTPPRSPTRKAMEEKNRKELSTCREEENKIRTLLTIVVHPSEEPDEPPEEWLLLEAEWFRAWSSFLNGAARPGKICNMKLLNDDSEPLPNLSVGKDYVGLDKKAWNLLSELYTADLAIVRPELDIYAQQSQR